MSRTRQLLYVIVVAVIAVGVVAIPASGKPHTSGKPHKVKKASGKQGKVTICHKPGKPAEKTLRVGAPAVRAHLRRHGDLLGACPEFDQIIDADGTATAQSGDPGAREVSTGDALATFPDGGATESGLDMFDQDSNQAWTQGVDDLHLEAPTFCPTGIRNGIHDLGADCKVLDLNGDLADGEPVDCDLEVAFSFSGMPCPPPGVKYHDANGNGSYDDGEDIVLDVNDNGVFD
jgi:hypothetical protein